jgi:hypothetical protein
MMAITQQSWVSLFCALFHGSGLRHLHSEVQMKPTTYSELSPGDYLSPAEIADRTPYTVKALETQRHKGKGPKWQACGRRIIYKWSDVVAWIENGGDK